MPAAVIALICLLFLCLVSPCGCSRPDEAEDGAGTLEDGAGTSDATRDGTGTPALQAARHDWGEALGRWHNGNWLEVPLEVERSLTPAQREEFRRLRSIGYLPGSSPVPANTGVVVYEGHRVQSGLNFYTSGHAPVAVLMDMSGRRLHEWRMSFEDAWRADPGDASPGSIKSAGYWRRAHLFENGDVLAIFEGLGLIRIDRDSNLLWARFGGFHHDLDVTDDGRIHVLMREPRIIADIHPELPVLEDFIVVLTSEGEELSRVSVLDVLRESTYASLLDGVVDSGDILHTNTLEVLRGRLEGRVPGFERGNVLICIRELDAIAVVDPGAATVVWATVGEWRKPHQPTVLDNGHILIFDNRGYRGRSQVIEFNPVNGDTTWVYRGEEPDDFYSWECGSNQRLENGNTLITESDRGKAFEVTPEGEIVWKFLNPMRAGGDLEFIATLFEMVRLPQDFPLDWMRREPGRVDG
ncbi:MAG: aryl-sulfate sulfotransferase [Candidatus Eisenbacteria bacterium]|nr:aryl-sulfate sulfotransferase [Candidatus Eisenbacteria bacterium]